MIGMTNYITDAKWADVFLVWYVLIDTGYQALEKRYGAWRRSGPEPVLQDSEVITIGLIIDTFFGGHEALGLAFLRQYHPALFPHLPTEGHFNERRTRLGPLIDQVRRWLTATGATVGLDRSTASARQCADFRGDLCASQPQSDFRWSRVLWRGQESWGQSLWFAPLPHDQPEPSGGRVDVSTRRTA